MSRPKGPVTPAERSQRRQAASKPRHHRHPRKPPALASDGEQGADPAYTNDHELRRGPLAPGERRRRSGVNRP